MAICKIPISNLPTSAGLDGSEINIQLNELSGCRPMRGTTNDLTNRQSAANITKIKFELSVAVIFCYKYFK
jgi:hypothetical protein